MNKILLSFLVLGLFTLGACNSEEDQSKETEQAHQEDNSEQAGTENMEQTKKYHFSQVDTYPFGEDYGEGFEAIAHKEDLGTVEVGPLTINVIAANLVTGTITDPFMIDFFGKENLDYINIAIEIDTTNEDIHFSSEHFKLTTNTGESFDLSNDSIGDGIDMQLIKEVYTRGRMIGYIFEESKVEDIENVDFLIKAPTDENGEPLGEDATITIDF